MAAVNILQPGNEKILVFMQCVTTEPWKRQKTANSTRPTVASPSTSLRCRLIYSKLLTLPQTNYN